MPDANLLQQCIGGLLFLGFCAIMLVSSFQTIREALQHRRERLSVKRKFVEDKEEKGGSM